MHTSLILCSPAWLPAILYIARAIYGYYTHFMFVICFSFVMDYCFVAWQELMPRFPLTIAISLPILLGAHTWLIRFSWWHNLTAWTSSVLVSLSCFHCSCYATAHLYTLPIQVCVHAPIAWIFTYLQLDLYMLYLYILHQSIKCALICVPFVWLLSRHVCSHMAWGMCTHIDRLAILSYHLYEVS